MEFNLFNLYRKYQDWSIDFFVVKFDIRDPRGNVRASWEPGIFRLSYTLGQWDWDLFGINELMHWWAMRNG